MRYFQSLILLFTQALCQHALKPTTILHQPHINVVNKNVTVVAGETAILPCSVDYLGTYKVVWMRGAKILTLEDRRIVSDERVSLERPFVKEWNLHIRKIETVDSGLYMCQINTDPLQVRSVTLVVHEPPSIIDYLSTPNAISVREHVTVELVCNVTGLPPPTVSWNRVSTGQWPEQGPAGARTRIGMDGEVLVIHNVTRYCDDIYECVAFNDVAPVATREIRVQVQYAPEVTLPVKKIGQVRGKGTILECEVVANPLNLSSWKKKGIDLTKNPNYYVDAFSEKNKVVLSLRIHAVTEEDYGEYECYAENLIGNDSEKMILHETPRPLPKSTTTTTVRPEMSQNIDQHDGGQLFNNGESHHWVSSNEAPGDKDDTKENDRGGHRHSDPRYNSHQGSNLGNKEVPDKSSVISDPNRKNSASITIKPAIMATIGVLIVACSR
ncbi:lachesin-like isoform X1 [Biomphalaria glabrata]|uniref:Lachesin-like isoform X1 n=2 Tax=Biomphalaria TaxID=6525 RepID=A0A9W3A1J2_BIOGL|nr:lachesin-like isoform X1 [Biomphalaria glabrata]XP_055881049.1 lachesin-like isoform X1 [Biomphalaria glabrata]